MIARPLKTVDELKTLPRGQFIVMKTGTHPMQTEFQLYLKWGIEFGEPFSIPEKRIQDVKYADRVEIQKAILMRYPKTTTEEPSTQPGKSPPWQSQRTHQLEPEEAPEITVQTDW